MIITTMPGIIGHGPALGVQHTRQIGGQMRMAVFGIDACVRDMSTTGLIVTYVKFCDEFVGFLNFCFCPT